MSTAPGGGGGVVRSEAKNDTVATSNKLYASWARQPDSYIGRIYNLLEL